MIDFSKQNYGGDECRDDEKNALRTARGLITRSRIPSAAKSEIECCRTKRATGATIGAA